MGSFSYGMKRVWDSVMSDSEKILQEGLEAGFIGDYAEAIEIFDKVIYLVIGHDDLKSNALFYKAIALDELNEKQKAIEVWKKFLKMEKKDYSSWGNLGKLYMDLGQFFEALKCFEESLKLEVSDPDLWVDKAESLVELSQLSEAEICAKKALEIDSKFVPALSILVDIFIEKKDFEKLPEIMKILDDSPHDSEILNTLGISYIALENYELSLSCFEEGLQFDPSDELMYYNKACVLSLMNKKLEALVALTIATSINPENLIDIKTEENFKNIKDELQFKKLVSHPI